MATARHLPLWTVIAPLVGWLLLGAAAAVTHGLHPLALSAGLIACVLAAVHHAEVVAHRVGELFGTLVLPNTTTSVAGQVVRVEHVTVQAGGQAIVGAVTQGGGGDISKSEERAQAQAALVHAPEPTLRCGDPPREPVPVTGGAGPETLSDARRSYRQRRQAG